MAYHDSFQGYNNTNESLLGNGFCGATHSFKCGTQGTGLPGQARFSATDCDAPASIYSDVPSGAVPRNNNSNHVTGVHNATTHLNLANHVGNLSVAADVRDDKNHPSIAPLQLHFPPVPLLTPPLPLPPLQSQTMPPSYHQHQHHHHHHSVPVHDDRSYQPYPSMSLSYGMPASLPMIPEASTSQHKLPGGYGPNHFCDFTPNYSDVRYVSGAVPQGTSDFSFGGEDDDVGYESDGYALEGEIHEPSDMELDSDAYRNPALLEQHHHAPYIQYQAPLTSNDPPQTQSCFKLTSSPCDPDWYSSDVNPEQNGLPCPWRTAGKDYWQQPGSFGLPWGQGVGAFHSDDLLMYQNHDSSPHCDYDARNTTPSDISSSASPLSPIDGLTYPVSHIYVPESSHSSSIPTQAPLPYLHSMSGPTYGYDPTVAVKSDDGSQVASDAAAPFIAAFLNGNGFANSASVPATQPPNPILHAPRPVRPIPTVSFEDLAASISDVQK